MVVTWLRALLFVVGGVTAAGVTAYVTGLLDPWFDEPATIASLPEPSAPEPAAPEPQEKAATPAVPQPDDPATTPKQPRLIIPTFDLLRVEPDGSIVIAGKAAPKATVEIITGDTILGKTTAGPEGDFATALDTPLEPGDYQIVLRSTTPDNVVATSTETALVSIPETESGQVLALVEEPGKPAELITVPEAPAAPEEPGNGDAPDAPDAAVAPEDDAETAQEQPAPAGDEAAPEGEQTAKDEPAAEPADDVANAPAAGEPSEDATTEPEAVAEADEPAQAEKKPAETEVAAAPEPEAPAVEKPQPAPAARVIVEAVEIEGDTVFVAGVADAGLMVRVYANDMLLGVTRASEGRRFLVEARRDLPVGDYIIRADLLGPDGSVVARAAVPFEREPGEAIAAIAPDAPSETAPAEEEKPAREEPEAAAAPEAAAPDAGGDEQADAEIAAAPEESAAESDLAETPEAGSAEEPAAGAVAEAPGAEDGEQPGEGGVAAAPEVGAPAEEPAETDVAAAPEGAAEAEDPAETDVASAPEAEAAPEVTAPKLESAKGAVIIRRGDTLWQISRRVYGRGVRYSTIYLANQDQIEDPDRIWPGQVFGVPNETDAGETADMEAIGAQAVPPDTESKIIR